MSKMNPKVNYHPYHPISEKQRKEFPEEVRTFENLLKLVGEPANLGCFTCEHYFPLGQNEFKKENLPWNSEDAFVHCGAIGGSNNYIRLKTGCSKWFPNFYQLSKEEEERLAIV